MTKTIYVSPQGDDKNDGLDEKTPVRTLALARKIAVKTKAQNIRLFSQGAWLTAELGKERKKK